MSLRWKIALALGALAATATIAVGIAGYRTTSDRLHGEVDRSLASAVSAVRLDRRSSRVVLPASGPFDSYQLQLLGPDGTVVESTFEDAVQPDDAALATVERPRTSATSTVSTPDGTYRVRTVGLPNGALQVARSLEETERVLASLRARTLVVMLLITAAAVLVGLLIAGRVTASLRRLTGAAESVAATGRLDVDVRSEGDDEVGRLGGAFQAMLAALARSRDDQRRLVQDAGHELRTPLTSLRTNLDVLRRHPELPAAERAQIVDDLHAETEELVALVNEVVAVASGEIDDEAPEPFSLGELVRETARRAERRSGRTIVVDADESPVVAQFAAVQRAVANLIDNARKFDVSGGQIEVTVRDGRVDVADHGPGIDDEDVHRVFDRFHRSEAARALPGSGLGLSIVRDVVVRHGGSVHASNREGAAPDAAGGAIVGFTLPVVSPASHLPQTGDTTAERTVSLDSEPIAGEHGTRTSKGSER
jgi:two-component system sensor histidine kinase MprB